MEGPLEGWAAADTQQTGNEQLTGWNGADVEAGTGEQISRLLFAFENHHR